MKKLSDFQGEEAVDLWADLLDPISEILTDKEVASLANSNKPPIVIAKSILKNHKAEAEEILLRIDPAPLNGLNIIVRLVAILAEIGASDELKSFFGYSVQAKTDNESSGSAMVNIEASEN